MLLGAACVAPQPSKDGWAWRVGDVGEPRSLRGLAPVSAACCFVGGSGGTLQRTTDGGATWQDVAPAGAGACDFRDVEVVDDRVVLAMVAGSPARLYRSEDRGDSWCMVHEDPRPGAFFDAVAFDGHHGVVFGDAIGGRFVLLETADAGRTWRDVPAPALPAPVPGEAAFAASGTCLVAGPIGFALVTGGGACRYVEVRPGISCTTRSLPMQGPGASQGAFSVAWRGARGVCVGGDYQDPARREGTAAITLDGGATWARSDAGGYRSGVAWVSDRAVVAVGSHGASWSVDGGRTFSPFGSEPFHSVARAPDGSVWACGAGGRVGRLVRRAAP